MLTRLASLITLLALSTVAAAQTAFTYQGRLNNGTSPASGLYDFRFTLYNTPTGGSAISLPQCFDNIQVTNGLFAVIIDFGQQFTSTANRFLEIEARPDSGQDCASPAGLAALTPRQPFTAAPFATHAKTAFSLAASDGFPVDAVVTDASGNVGIGTTTTTALLSVGSTTNRGTLNVVGSSTTVPFVTLSDSRAGGRQFSLYGGLSGLGSFNIYDQTAAAHRLTINSGGNVGIGTPSPLAKLQVNGDIRLGSTGQFLAAAGDENLRIIRGSIAANGVVLAGSGFAVSHTQTGVYVIAFSTAFAGTPTVTATGDYVGTQAAFWEVSVDNVSASSTHVRTNFPTGPVTDAPFHFIAIGPR